MSWYAKPGFTGNGYAIDSVEAATNAFAISDYFRNIWNYTLEATVGIVANSFGESGLNPWIYEADPDQPGIINPNLGYGLFQFTPMSQYLNNSFYATGMPGQYGPCYSAPRITPAAKPPSYGGANYGYTNGDDSDGRAQCTILARDSDIGLHKWVNTCWRTYWDRTAHPTEAATSARILSTYGSNGAISQAQFSQIPDIYDATFCFFACYEGPGDVTNVNVRYDFAQTFYTILTGNPPPPKPSLKTGMPVYMMIRRF